MLLTVIALLATLPAPPACAQGLTRRTLEYQGVTRTWFEHVPASYDGGARAVPLVISLHGFNSSGDVFAPITEWVPKADAAGFIVVFPNGGLKVGDTAFGWNNFVFDGSAPDDVGFLLALIQRLESDFRVDPARVFMNGFSNGAGMTNNFAGLHASALAGIAPVSGGWLSGFGIPDSAMHPDAPLPVWVWGGEKETFPNGSETLREEAQRQTQYWVSFNGNDSAPLVTVQPPLTTSVFPNGRAEVRRTEYANGEHAYQPGTSAKIWDDFFSRQARSKIPAPQPIPPPSPPPTPLPTITISAEAPTVFEAGRIPASFLVRRGGDTSTGLAVLYTVGGSAIGGVQYKALSGQVLLPAGSNAAAIKVKPLDGGARGGDVKVKLTLQPGNGYLLGAENKAKVRIVEGN